MNQLHKSVLLDEVLSFVKKPTKSKFTFVDMTLGRGGHSRKIIEKLDSENLNYYGFDCDDEAIKYVNEDFKNLKGNINIVKSKFSKAIDYLKENDVAGIDLCLFDIGVSSPQFDDPKRGFSYRFDAKLDMRMDQSQKLSCYEVVNTYSERDLTRIIYDYGDEKFAKSIAKNICLARQNKTIETTFELVDIIKSSLPKKQLFKEHHPAKRTFMALRYEVNKEHDELIDGLKKATEFLNKDGILMIITFNSHEDAIVKRYFDSLTKEVFISKYLPPSEKEVKYKVLTKKPIAPSYEEIEDNPRCKPSKLRAIQKL